jgi:hypothetical protein
MQYSVYVRSICSVHHKGKIYVVFRTKEEYIQDSVHRKDTCSNQYMGRVYAVFSTFKKVYAGFST